MGLALSMMLGMVFALMPQEVEANMGGAGAYCYSSSSGSQEGAFFYHCQPNSEECPKVDGIPYGPPERCNSTGGGGGGEQ